MSATVLLENVKIDTVGADTSIRIVGTREPPAKMSVQISITGTASVQIQGRISKTAPWIEVGDMKSTSCLMFVEPVPFMRALVTGMSASSLVTVWAAWGWF